MNGNNGSNGPVRRYRKRRGSSGVAFIAVMLLLMAVGVVLLVMSVTGTGLFGNSSEPSDTDAVDSKTENADTDDNSDDIDTDVAGTDSADTQNDPSKPQYSYLDKTTEDVGAGFLTLIDGEHLYKFKNESLKALYREIDAKLWATIRKYTLENGDTKEDDVMLNPEVIKAFNDMVKVYVEEVGFKDLMIADAYRSFDYQNALYKNEKNSGVAIPGGSDYHSGATFVLKASINGVTKDISTLTEANSNWFKDNMAKYGFVFRSPSNKKSVVGYAIKWQLRYVGVPHAVYMSKNDLCLEEYLDELASKHRFGDEHLIVDCTAENGEIYEIYYVDCASEGITKLPVPKSGSYTVSGDNKSGFIVAVKLDAVG